MSICPSCTFYRKVLVSFLVVLSCFVAVFVPNVEPVAAVLFLLLFFFFLSLSVHEYVCARVRALPCVRVCVSL